MDLINHIPYPPRMQRVLGDGLMLKDVGCMLPYYLANYKRMQATFNCAGIPTLDRNSKRELTRLITGHVAKTARNSCHNGFAIEGGVLVEVLEAAIRIGEFHNEGLHWGLSQQIYLRKNKPSLRGRGKQTAAGLAAFVENVGALLAEAGIPFATGENSLFVRILDIAASAAEIRGTPRNYLRKLVRKKRGIGEAQIRAVQQVLQRGLAPFATRVPNT